MQPDIILSPVGFVRVNPRGFVLEFEPALKAALVGLEGYSHINVLWWAHYLADPAQREMRVCQQPYQKGPARVGVFATRSPQRPNPIGLSVAQVTWVDAARGEIGLAYIDALDGTPILDVKPYLGCSDRVRQASVPAWCRHWPEWYEDSAIFAWEEELEGYAAQ